MSVAEPFCLGHAAHHPLADIARDYGAALVRDASARSIPGAHGDDGLRRDDRLRLAADRRRRTAGAGVPARDHVRRRRRARGARPACSRDLEEGYAKRVAFVVPSTVAWTLPLYELAVMTARDVWSVGIDGVHLAFVTPEARPLEVVRRRGLQPMVAELLERGAASSSSAASYADVGHGFVLAGDRRIEVDRTLTLPVPAGPAIAGLPAERPRLHPGRRARPRAGRRGCLRGRRRHARSDQAGRARGPAGRRGGRGDRRAPRHRHRPPALPAGPARDAA